MAFASNDAPIGIVVSGFGGLTVANAVSGRLPNEPSRYLGDTARQPYASKCPDRLVGEGVTLLVNPMRDAGLHVPEHQFRTTGDPAQFREVGRRFRGPELAHVDALGALT